MLSPSRSGVTDYYWPIWHETQAWRDQDNLRNLCARRWHRYTTCDLYFGNSESRLIYIIILTSYSSKLAFMLDMCVGEADLDLLVQ